MDLLARQLSYIYSEEHRINSIYYFAKCKKYIKIFVMYKNIHRAIDKNTSQNKKGCHDICLCRFETVFSKW